MEYRKRINSASGLTRHMHACISQIIQSSLPIHIQPKQNTPMPGDDNDVSENFGPYEDKEFTLKERDIEGDYKDLVVKSSNTRSCVRDGFSECTL